MCQAVNGNPETYKQDATALVELANRCSGQQLIDCFRQDSPPENAEELWSKVEAIANNEKFKYSRLFAIGLYTFLGEAEPKLLEEAEKRDEMLATLTESMNLPGEKMKKDLDLYRSNLEKMSQVLEVIEDALIAERKRREKTEEKEESAALESTTESAPTEENSETPAE